jgi:copper transport protein
VLRRAGTLIGVCLTLGVLVANGSAGAHAVLEATDPEQGAVVATVPAVVSLTFSEAVVVSPDGVRVFGPDGHRVDNGRTVHLGRPATVGVGVTGSQLGTYTVAWRVISADSHPVAGAFTFSVGHPSPSRAPGNAQPGGSGLVGVLYAAVRAAAFAGYAVLVGSVGFVLLCWPPAISRRDVRGVMLAGWAGLLLTTVAALLLQGPYGEGLGLDRVLDPAVVSLTLSTPFGAALTARLALLALAGAYVVLLCAGLGQLRGMGRVGFATLGTGLGLGLAGTWAVAGHASVGLQPALAVPVDVAHLLAMGLWLGGLLVLLVTLRPQRAAHRAPGPAKPPGEPGEPGEPPGGAVHRFSLIATTCVLTIVATGSYQSWRQLGSWGAFVSTGYGRLLLAKLCAVALLLLMASRARRCVTLAVPRGLRRSLRGEALLGVVVLSITAVLVNAVPARTAVATPAGPAYQIVGYDTGAPSGRGRLIVTIDPAMSGPNTVRVTVVDLRGTRRDVAELHASLTLPARQLGPFPIPLQRHAPGEYSTSGFQLPYPGTWQLTVTVRTGELDQTTVTAPIRVR